MFVTSAFMTELLNDGGGFFEKDSSGFSVNYFYLDVYDTVWII